MAKYRPATEDFAYARALRIIAHCDERQTKLSLRALDLQALPVEIGRLSQLKALDLEQNELTTLPPEIASLTRLEGIRLTSNKLTSLPPEIGHLTALIWLRLDSNQLASLPPEIGKLTNLRRLYLQHNALVTLPGVLRELPKLQRLYLHDNPGLPISPSILGADIRETEEGLVSAKSILDFYFDRQDGPTRPLNEVKLILVGRGGAGKTSISRAMRGLPFRVEEKSTPGIALSDWTMDECEKATVTAHIWDFAGQVITHALHQFFFSVRSVYVLVLTGRENSERQDAEYWLRLIKAFGTDDQGHGPPVIVALNKWETAGARPRIDQRALKERYPFIRELVPLDCKTGRGVSDLKTALNREVDQLKWVREPIPESWNAVRQALGKGKRRKAFLTYSEYRSLCKRHGVVDPGKQDSLAEILHNLGAALNYRNDTRLREATVLQPEWLTRNVYALMRRAEKQAGVLKQSDVDKVLYRIKNLEMRDYLVRIMERFEIAYSRASSTGVWLVPQALPDVQPEGAEEFSAATDATRLRYSYQALPEGLVARAMVRLHDFIEVVEGKEQQWASGAILVRLGARAMIRSHWQERRVAITATGPAKARQQLAGLCQSEMREIHGEFPGLEPIEETRVGDAWISTRALEEDEKHGHKTGVATDRGTEYVDPSGPNDAFSDKRARSEELWKPRAFISYSKSDVKQRKSLESVLKVLKNEGLLAAAWHDRMIDPGDEWDETIQSSLEEADVVIILVSTAALATDYITEHEIPRALELREAGEIVVVPVILEKSRWKNTPLGKLNALPEKGKPLNHWKPQPDGWSSIADGLAHKLSGLIESARQ